MYTVEVKMWGENTLLRVLHTTVFELKKNNNFIQVDMFTQCCIVLLFMIPNLCFYLCRCGVAGETQTEVCEQGA